MKAPFIVLLVLVISVPAIGQNQLFHVYIGSAGTQAVIGDTLLVPISVYCSDSTTVLGYMDIPMDARNSCVAGMYEGYNGPGTQDWVPASFRDTTNPDSTMPGWTDLDCQMQWRMGNIIGTPYNPRSGQVILYHKVRIADSRSIIGTSDTIFNRGMSPFDPPDSISFGDTSGSIGYFNRQIHRFSVTFLEDYAVGSGVGYSGAQNPIETHRHNPTGGSLTYRLEDCTRRFNSYPRRNNGHLNDSSFIATYAWVDSTHVKVITDSDNNWNDSTAVDAHVYAAKVYDYLLNDSCHWNSYDAMGSSIISAINDSALADNAGWDPRFNRINYGIVSAGHNSFAGCLEVTAHELAHPILTNRAHLIYDSNGEVSALDEAWCNILGVAARYHIKNQSPSDDWYHIGEIYNRSTTPIIDMQNPHNTGQPDYFQDPIDWQNIAFCIPSVSNDYCHAHINEGVINKMFYFLAHGDSSIHNNVVVQGIGVDTAFNIMWKASNWADGGWYYWTDSFLKAREGCVRAALGLGRWDWAVQTANAWNAVGICDSCTYVPGDVNNSGYFSGLDIVYFTNWLRGGPPPPKSCILAYHDTLNFYVAADLNGNCAISGVDVTYGVAYLEGGPALKWCPHFTPGTP